MEKRCRAILGVAIAKKLTITIHSMRESTKNTRSLPARTRTNFFVRTILLSPAFEIVAAFFHGSAAKQVGQDHEKAVERQLIGNLF